MACVRHNNIEKRHTSFCKSLMFTEMTIRPKVKEYFFNGCAFWCS